MRLTVFSLILLTGPAMAGCLDGNVGLCLGQQTPTKILRGDQCSQWTIEVDHVGGQGPDSSALSLLKTRMTGLVHKDSITITVDDTGLQGRSEWSFEQLHNLEAQTRDLQTGGTTITTHVLYVDGQLQNEPDVLAFASGSRYVVVFKQAIRDASGDDDPVDFISTTATQMERAVLVHEFGHVLGLVNNGIPMQTDREDDDHPGHSTNEDSVMFWAVESTSALDFFADTAPPTAFDANDKADTCAAGGKC